MKYCRNCFYIILSTLLFASCTVGCQSNLSPERMLTADVDFLVAEIQTMYNNVRPELLYDPNIYIAFADIDFDEIPEFFFGYHTMTGSHNKVWYRAYSLKEHSMVDSEHPQPPYWSTYLDDKACDFFTGTENFLEGYFLNNSGEPCFVTKAHTGPAAHPRIDFTFIQYEDLKMSIETGSDEMGTECNEDLTPLKQAFSLVEMGMLNDNITHLLDVYLQYD